MKNKLRKQLIKVIEENVPVYMKHYVQDSPAHEYGVQKTFNAILSFKFLNLLLPLYEIDEAWLLTRIRRFSKLTPKESFDLTKELTPSNLIKIKERR